MTGAIPGNSDGWQVPGRHSTEAWFLPLSGGYVKTRYICVYMCVRVRDVCVCICVRICMLAVECRDRICVCVSFRNVCNTLKVYIGNQVTRVIDFNKLTTHLPEIAFYG